MEIDLLKFPVDTLPSNLSGTLICILTIGLKKCSALGLKKFFSPSDSSLKRCLLMGGRHPVISLKATNEVF